MSHVIVLCVENLPAYMGAPNMLETAGYEVMAATNRDQALRLLTALLQAQCITVLRPSGREVSYTWKLLSRPIGSPRR
jgi:hypothetical protein